jgi:hypothetical protein
MSTVPSDLRDLDSGWEDSPAEPEPADQAAEANTKIALRPKPAASVEVRDLQDPPTAQIAVRREEARETLPPPVPISELLAKMMSPEIDSSVPAALLDPSQAVPPKPAPRRPASSPSIEAAQITSEAMFHELSAEILGPQTSPRLDEIDDPAMPSVEEPRSAMPRSSGRDFISRITPQPRPAFRSSENLGDIASDRTPKPLRRHTPLGLPITEPVSSPELRVKSESFLMHSERTPATIPGGPPTERLTQVRDRYEAGDYSGALVIAEGLLEENPDHIAALGYAESCREMLRQMYQSRIGEGALVPRVMVDKEQLRWMSLDHRAGFLLSCVDGLSSIDEILDVSGMPPLDALRLIYELLQEGVIALEMPPGRNRR